jgi:hypothetical protein
VNNSDKNKAILDMQAARSAVNARVVKHLSFLSDEDLHKLDALVKKRRNAAGNYTTEEFLALPQRTKAVILAQDVIGNIALNRFKIKRQVYVRAENFLPDSVRELSIGTPEGVCALNDAKCNVCAKGALFMSSVLKTNDITVGDVTNAWSHDIRQRLVDDEAIFDLKTYDLIEAAFEGNVFNEAGENWNYHFGDGEIGDESSFIYGKDGYAETVTDIRTTPRGRRMINICRGFFKSFKNAERRLVAIMVNVIENKGIFRPEFIPGKKLIDDALKNAIVPVTAAPMGI